MIGGSIKTALYPRFSKEADDTYIYYLIMKYTFFASTVLSLLYLASCVFSIYFDLYVFRIYINPHDILGSMISGYSFPVATVLYLIFLPYGCLLFRANIDFNEIDLLHWNDLILQRTGGDRYKLLSRYLFLVPIVILVSYNSWGPIALLLDYYPALRNSYIAFLLLVSFEAWLYSFFPYVVVSALATTYQLLWRRGPRYRALNQDKS